MNERTELAAEAGVAVEWIGAEEFFATRDAALRDQAAYGVFRRLELDAEIASENHAIGMRAKAHGTHRASRRDRHEHARRM